MEENRTLIGVPTGDTLPDLVTNSSGVDINSGAQDLEAANVLLSLGDSLESMLDDPDDNANLMPIGGEGIVPVDAAPQPLRLDQVSVDAAIAGMVQSEELTIMPAGDKSNPETVNTVQEPDNNTAKEDDNKPEDDIPLSELAKTLEESKSPTKGVLKTKTYGLKKKPDSKRTFKCPACDTWKSSVQRLNDHYKRRHPPQMCGICGRTFTFPSSLQRHMYDHDEKRYKCDKCEHSFHFESELVAHRVSHRSKAKPTFQCMKSKCGKWFMRKWDLTLHLKKHNGKKHECDFKDCTFSTSTEKTIKRTSQKSQ